jgi:ketosteroid isomerase-like protein
MATRRRKKATRSVKRATGKKRAAPKRAAPKRAGAQSKARRGGTDLRAFARRIVDVTRSNDDDATLALYAADVESTEQGQPPMRGIDSIRQKFAGWRSMVSDSHFEPRRVCVDGNTIVIEWVGDVTLNASGKRAQLHEVAIHEIRDGKIVREAYFYDPGTLR